MGTSVNDPASMKMINLVEEPVPKEMAASMQVNIPMAMLGMKTGQMCFTHRCLRVWSIVAPRWFSVGRGARLR